MGTAGISSVTISWLDVIDSQRWLYQRYGSSQLHPSTQKLVQRMQEAYTRGDQNAVYSVIENIKNISTRLGDKTTRSSLIEQAEAWIVCAVTAARMGDIPASIGLFREAIVKCKAEPHYEAVALWMLGCVQWIYPNQYEDAIVSWARSLEIIKQSSMTGGATAPLARWYNWLHGILKGVLDQAIDDNTLPPPPTDLFIGSGPAGGGIGTGPRPVSPPPSSSASTARPGFTPPPGPTPASPTSSSGATPAGRSPSVDLLRLFTVTDQIPAGSPAPVGFDPKAISFIEIDQVQIEGKPYGIMNLKGGHILNLPEINKLFALRVTGDSMDLLGIYDGDYVLLRSQPTADPNDIVAAEIASIDRYATLKRYIERGNDTILLQPESSNAAHKDQKFSKAERDVKFSIKGVAVAVLRQMPNP